MWAWGGRMWVVWAVSGVSSKNRGFCHFLDSYWHHVVRRTYLSFLNSIIILFSSLNENCGNLLRPARQWCCATLRGAGCWRQFVKIVNRFSVFVSNMKKFYDAVQEWKNMFVWPRSVNRNPRNDKNHGFWPRPRSRPTFRLLRPTFTHFSPTPGLDSSKWSFAVNFDFGSAKLIIDDFFRPGLRFRGQISLNLASIALL